MSDGQALFLVLALLHLSECALWIGRSSVLFSRSALRRGRWRARFPGNFLGNPRGSLGWLPLLPPFGRAFLCHAPPISISPLGICPLSPRHPPGRGPLPPAGRALAFEEIRRVEADERDLRVNGTRFARCATPLQASRLAVFVSELTPLDPTARDERLRAWMEAQFDLAEARKRAAAARRRARALQPWCAGHFAFLFALAPLLAWRLGLDRVLLPAAAVMLLSAAFIARSAWKTLSAGPDQPPRLELAKAVATMILCPPAAARAPDHATLQSLADFHPATVATLLAPDAPVTRELILWRIRDLRHPARVPSEDPLARGIVSDCLRLEHECLLRFVLEHRPGECLELRPPVRDGAAQAYCPRCECQMETATGECPDCPGVALVRFDGAKETAQSPT